MQSYSPSPSSKSNKRKSPLRKSPSRQSPLSKRGSKKLKIKWDEARLQLLLTIIIEKEPHLEDNNIRRGEIWKEVADKFYMADICQEYANSGSRKLSDKFQGYFIEVQGKLGLGVKGGKSGNVSGIS